MTKLFDFISHHGHNIAEKRAKKADSQFSADWEARRVAPGVVLGTEGPGGLDGLFREISTKAKYRPWWLKITLRIHWWLAKHGPSATARNIKYFWQRGKRGWSDRDIWGFDDYLATVIRDGVAELNRTKHGWPGEPMTFEEWGQILTEISDGMQAHLDMMDPVNTDRAELPSLETKRDLGFTHLAEHFGSLWD